jgi:DNA-binding transcriptional ArsR family regulator
MAKPKFDSELKRRDAMVVVARYDRAGCDQTEIAKALERETGVKVSQPTVSSYLRKLKDEYKARAIEDRDVMVKEKCAQFADLRREAWLAWDRSQTLDDEGEKKAGDSRFLSVMMDTLRAECDLLGLDAPKKSEVLTGTLDLNKLLGPAGAEDLVEKQIKEIHAAPGIVEGEASPPAPGWYGAIKTNGKKKHS